MLTFVEDVGRHNAIDTIAGWMWLHGVERRRQDVLHDRPPDERDGDQVGADGRADRRLAQRHHADGATRSPSGSAWRCSAARRNRHFLCYCGFDRFDGGSRPQRRGAACRQRGFEARRPGRRSIRRSSRGRAAPSDRRAARSLGSSGRFQPSTNSASATMNIGPTRRPTRSSTKAGFLPSYQWPTNWIDPADDEEADSPCDPEAPSTCGPAASAHRPPHVTARPRTTLPRVRYQSRGQPRRSPRPA